MRYCSEQISTYPYAVTFSCVSQLVAPHDALTVLDDKSEQGENFIPPTEVPADGSTAVTVPCMWFVLMHGL